MRIKAAPVSHLAYLIEWVEKSYGEIVELGIGIGSTPLLHELCRVRRLTSYENNNAIYSKFHEFDSEWHQLWLIDSWPSANLERPWGLAFVDHDPPIERRDTIRRLKGHADYILVHDTEPRHDRRFRIRELFKDFKYCREYTDYEPHTTILSDKYAL